MTSGGSGESFTYLELVINHNQSTHAQNLDIMDDIAPPQMKFYDEFSLSLCS